MKKINRKLKVMLSIGGKKANISVSTLQSFDLIKPIL
jgi:hypothetical protein